ncbi:MAG: NAD(+) synthase [Saprospiraceae bacterium]|nr:MAG: NAD+ synthetase [Bacteroidetes bacterium OLB9]MCO6464199.1 NAD(+) synthase [Saprospiraceae bacterium]MCZ2337202.1 NAD(+) synthase [Chitinophagales bacterium]
MKTDKIANFIVDWLKQYLINSHQKGFVIGISGGVDSAVTSTLCAMTGYPVLCLELPIRQKSSEVSRAKNHIQWLQSKYSQVRSLEVDLTTVFEEFVRIMPESSHNTDLAEANSRSRLRMTTLYYFAGIYSYIVAGTGNKVEDFGVGFYTKYGDGGVDVSPIGDLMKTEVYQLAKYLDIIPEIQAAIPTDGLFDDSLSDEDQLGASYPELEWAMRQAESGSSVEAFSGRDREVFEIYMRRHRSNLHKMIPIPVCLIPPEWKD